jgi:uncharacterized protein (DUF111 family)
MVQEKTIFAAPLTNKGNQSNAKLKPTCCNGRSKEGLKYVMRKAGKLGLRQEQGPRQRNKVLESPK